MSDGLPRHMRVARVHAWGDVRVETAEVPRPGPGEIVVHIDACGVCGSDALDWYVATKVPAVLGHEPAATVAAVGAGVSAVRAGDRVFVHHHAPCGVCAECRRSLWSNCATWRRSQLDPGGFAEYARVGADTVARDLLPLPDGMDTETATFIEPVACCLRAVRRQGAVCPGDVVFIVGLGAMGLVMAQLARIGGAAVVLGSDFVAGRRDLAVSLGVDAALDPSEGPAAEGVRGLTEGRGADVVIVCPGDARAIDTGIAAAAPGGRVVCFTPLPPGTPLEVDANRLYFREIALLQSYSCGPDETRAALDLLRHQRLRVAPLITHRAGLEGVGEALVRAKQGGDGIKTIIVPHESRPA